MHRPDRGILPDLESAGPVGGQAASPRRLFPDKLAGQAKRRCDDSLPGERLDGASGTAGRKKSGLSFRRGRTTRATFRVPSIPSAAWHTFSVPPSERVKATSARPFHNGSAPHEDDPKRRPRSVSSPLRLRLAFGEHIELRSHYTGHASDTARFFGIIPLFGTTDRTGPCLGRTMDMTVHRLDGRSALGEADPQTAGPLIALDDVTLSYGSNHALRGVTCRLPPGRIGLLGPNGAGKSTLLKILLGLLRPTSGSGQVLGVDLRHAGPLLRRAVGYMSEADALVPGLRGVDYVALAGELYGMERAQAQRRAHELLTCLGLEDARYRALEEYSTGMKQRIKLAAALVHDPPMLLLDEPTSGLDPAGRDAMLRLLLGLGRDHGKSFLLSTHLLGDVERVCETVLIIHQGRVLRQGGVEELRTPPAESLPLAGCRAT